MTNEEEREFRERRGGTTLWMVEWLREVKEGQGDIPVDGGDWREVDGEGRMDWSTHALEGTNRVYVFRFINYF